MSKFSHYQWFHGSRQWLIFNQSANSWDAARSCWRHTTSTMTVSMWCRTMEHFIFSQENLEIQMYPIYRKDHRIFFAPDSQLKIGGAAIFLGADCHQSSAIPSWPMCVTIQGPSIPSEVDSKIFEKGGPWGETMSKSRTKASTSP